MSLRKERLSWVFILLFLAVIGAAAYFVLLPQLRSQMTLRLGDGIFKAVTLSPEESSRQAGGDVPQLSDNKAIIHVYDADAFWLIDTKYRSTTFDIIWLDKDKKVVHIVKNASSESEPDTLFQPKEVARYIVELRGGTVEEKAIRITSTAIFEDEKNEEGKQ